MQKAELNNVRHIRSPRIDRATGRCASSSTRTLGSYRRRGRGVAYVFIIGLGILLAAACYGMLTVTRLAGRSYQQARDMRDAEVLAESAVQRAAALLAKNPTTWRTTYANNVETTQVAVGRGTVSFKLVDEGDANLANNAFDNVRVYGY